MTMLEEFLQGHWSASVFHCPPPRSRRGNPIANASSIRLSGEHQTKDAAEHAALKSIESGWARNVVLHRESAKPMVQFHLSEDAFAKIKQARIDLENAALSEETET